MASHRKIPHAGQTTLPALPSLEQPLPVLSSDRSKPASKRKASETGQPEPKRTDPLATYGPQPQDATQQGDQDGPAGAVVRGAGAATCLRAVGGSRSAGRARRRLLAAGPR